MARAARASRASSRRKKTEDEKREREKREALAEPIEEPEVKMEEEEEEEEEKDDGMRDIRLDIEAKCSALQAFAEDATLALRSELKVQLLKMPKKVRSMPLKDFLSKFAGDINKVIVDELNARFVSLENATATTNELRTARKGRRRGAGGGGLTTVKKGPVPATVMATRTTRKRAREATELGIEPTATQLRRSTRSRTRASLSAASVNNHSAVEDQVAVPKTPAVARQPFTPLVGNNASSGLLPSDTVLRNPKRGEVFFSKNGSPLGMMCEEENGNSLMTPIVAGMAKQWTGSAIKTCATVRCKTRCMEQIEEGEEENMPLSPEDLQILLTNEDGEEIKLDEEGNNDNLPVDIKSMALGKLMGLQNKVMSMIASLHTK